MGIDRRPLQALVFKQLLDHADIIAIVQWVNSERVPQHLVVGSPKSGHTMLGYRSGAMDHTPPPDVGVGWDRGNAYGMLTGASRSPWPSAASGGG
jgi:hypothetical protein